MNITTSQSFLFDLLVSKSCLFSLINEFLYDWSHLNLRRHNFDFHLYNTVAVVTLFVFVTVAVVVVPVVVAVGKNVQAY